MVVNSSEEVLNWGLSPIVSRLVPKHLVRNSTKETTAILTQGARVPDFLSISFLKRLL
jgi:hypothetical protein